MPARLHSLAHQASLKRSLFAFAFLLMFWGMFDGLMSYVTPLLITEAGLSTVAMGWIIGSSSIVGAIVDFLICRVVRQPHVRRYLLLMFAVSLVYPLILGFAQTPLIFLLAMLFWAIYYDLAMFAKFDFVGRYTPHRDHARSFGILEVFIALGYFLAPLFAGLLIGDQVGWGPLILGWLFLGCSLMLYAFFTSESFPSDELHPEVSRVCRKRDFVGEIRVWTTIGRRLAPVLILTLFSSILSGVFWTLGPLLASSLTSLNGFEGIFVAAHELPFLLTGWFIGRITQRFGKKRTAFVSCVLGSLFIGLIGIFSQPLFIIATAFVGSFFFAAGFPAINGAYADYIEEADQLAFDIEGVQDASTNLGFVVGPILGGMLASWLTIPLSFTWIGALGMVVGLVLLLKSPRSIRVDDLGTSA